MKDNPEVQSGTNDLVQLEVHIQGRPDPVSLSIREDEVLPQAVLAALGLSEDFQLFERDKDGPVVGEARGRKAMKLLAHKPHHITVHVRYEHDTKSETFPPSKSVFKVLQWAVSKKAYGLDPVASAKANLMLPNASEPLPRDKAIGDLVTPGETELTLDLTLRDFTNG